MSWKIGLAIIGMIISFVIGFIYYIRNKYPIYVFEQMSYNEFDIAGREVVTNNSILMQSIKETIEVLLKLPEHAPHVYRILDEARVYRTLDNFRYTVEYDFDYAYGNKYRNKFGSIYISYKGNRICSLMLDSRYQLKEVEYLDLLNINIVIESLAVAKRLVADELTAIEAKKESWDYLVKSIQVVNKYPME